MNEHVQQSPTSDFVQIIYAFNVIVLIYKLSKVSCYTTKSRVELAKKIMNLSMTRAFP